MTFGDNPLGQSDSNAETLLAVGVAILYVVVADFLVGERLERLHDVDPLIVDNLCGDILGQILLPLIGMVREGKLAVTALDVFLACGLCPVSRCTG